MIRVVSFYCFVAIYDSTKYTEKEANDYLMEYTVDCGGIKKKDGIVIMRKDDWHKLHEMILKDYTPKEV